MRKHGRLPQVPNPEGLSSQLKTHPEPGQTLQAKPGTRAGEDGIGGRSQRIPPPHPSPLPLSRWQRRAATSRIWVQKPQKASLSQSHLRSRPDAEAEIPTSPFPPLGESSLSEKCYMGGKAINSGSPISPHFQICTQQDQEGMAFSTGASGSERRKGGRSLE